MTLSPRQRAMLAKLPLPIEGMDGRTKRTLLVLANAGLATASGSTATRTPKGDELIAPTTKTKRRGGIRRQPDGPAKARERDAAPTSNPTLDELRRIRAEVEKKLRALDETIEIVEALA